MELWAAEPVALPAHRSLPSPTEAGRAGAGRTGGSPEFQPDEPCSPDYVLMCFWGFSPWLKYTDWKEAVLLGAPCLSHALRFSRASRAEDLRGCVTR